MFKKFLTVFKGHTIVTKREKKQILLVIVALFISVVFMDVLNLIWTTYLDMMDKPFGIGSIIVVIIFSVIFMLMLFLAYFMGVKVYFIFKSILLKEGLE